MSHGGIRAQDKLCPLRGSEALPTAESAKPRSSLPHPKSWGPKSPLPPTQESKNTVGIILTSAPQEHAAFSGCTGVSSLF